MRYFTFPSEAELLKQWISACQLDLKYNPKNCRVCSQHFLNEDYSLRDQLLKTPFEKRKLKKDAVPSVNLPAPLIQSNRLKRYNKRCTKKLVKELISASNE